MALRRRISEVNTQDKLYCTLAEQVLALQHSQEKDSLAALTKVAQNLLSGDLKHRRIRAENSTFRAKFAIPAAEQVLRCLGFERKKEKIEGNNSQIEPQLPGIPQEVEEEDVYVCSNVDSYVVNICLELFHTKIELVEQHLNARRQTQLECSKMIQDELRKRREEEPDRPTSSRRPRSSSGRPGSQGRPRSSSSFSSSENRAPATARTAQTPGSAPDVLTFGDPSPAAPSPAGSASGSATFDRRPPACTPSSSSSAEIGSRGTPTIAPAGGARPSSGLGGKVLSTGAHVPTHTPPVIKPRTPPPGKKAPPQVKAEEKAEEKPEPLLKAFNKLTFTKDGLEGDSKPLVEASSPADQPQTPRREGRTLGGKRADSTTRALAASAADSRREAPSSAGSSTTSSAPAPPPPAADRPTDRQWRQA